MQIKRAYIRDQARKRIIQGDHHACFFKHRHQRSANWNLDRIMKAVSADYFLSRYQDRLDTAMLNIKNRLIADVRLDYIGNMNMLSSEHKLPLVCHRRDARLFEMQKAAILKAAREGAVIVSAFISEKERDIKKQLMQELLPFIEIMDNGFSDRYKPSGKAFYALAENRLTQITCWDYVYQKDANVTREMCLVMNELSRVICGVRDDWWKTGGIQTL